MWDKERGWGLSIDQASMLAGVSLWFNGTLKAYTTLEGGTRKTPMSNRLKAQVEQLDAFLDAHLKDDECVSFVLFEDVKAKQVQMICGAYLTSARINCKISKDSLVHTRTWKSWAQRMGAGGPIKDIKGVAALEATGWDFNKYPTDSDDIADSILMYLAWRAR